MIIHDKRGMVGETSCLVNPGCKDPIPQSRGDDLVVDTPTHIILPRASTVRPPGILFGLPVHHPEGIDKISRAKQLIHPGPLLRQKTGIFLVAAPVLQIDLLVRYIPVAANDILPPFAAQTVEIWHKLIQKLKLEILPFITGCTRRRIQRNDTELPKLHLQITSLTIKERPAETHDHLVRPIAAVNRDTRITPLLCIVIEAVKTPGMKHAVAELILLRLGFLDTDQIRPLSAQPLKESLASR